MLQVFLGWFFFRISPLLWMVQHWEFARTAKELLTRLCPSSWRPVGHSGWICTWRQEQANKSRASNAPSAIKCQGPWKIRSLVLQIEHPKLASAFDHFGLNLPVPQFTSWWYRRSAVQINALILIRCWSITEKLTRKLMLNSACGLNSVC